MAERKMVRAVRLLMPLFCLCLPQHVAASSSISSPSPLCAGSGAALVVLREPLSFCELIGMSCCDAAADAALRKQFRALNVSGAACAAIVKDIICSKCLPSHSTEPFSAADPATVARSIPRLCASPPSPRSSAAASRPGTKGAEGRANPGLAWLLSFGACAVALAFYQVYVKMFAGDTEAGRQRTNCNGWFSCCATIMCCNSATTSSGPSASRQGSEDIPSRVGV